MSIHVYCTGDKQRHVIMKYVDHFSTVHW